MQQAIEKLEALLSECESYFGSASEQSLETPIAPGKWSRKQILGHLIDSAVNNLTRFTEIGYRPQPYVYREYNQDELVKINDYQSIPKSELLQLWLSLNKQILRIMQSQSKERLALKIKFPDGTLSDLRFIINDYPEHMRHHINQITQQ